jgi:hypothetical protein
LPIKPELVPSGLGQPQPQLPKHWPPKEPVPKGLPKLVPKGSPKTEPVPKGDDDEYWASLDGTIKEAQSDVAVGLDYFTSKGDKGSIADEKMSNPGDEVPPQKKRVFDDDAEDARKEDSAKIFFISKHRVDEAVKQIGGGV